MFDFEFELTSLSACILSKFHHTYYDFMWHSDGNVRAVPLSLVLIEVNILAKRFWAYMSK